jgi:hypothetical protein
MTKEQCLKRAAECNRLAEAASDPDMKLYLMKLALTWMQSAAEADGKGEQSRLGCHPVSLLHRDRAAVQPER